MHNLAKWAYNKSKKLNQRIATATPKSRGALVALEEGGRKMKEGGR
jgi:hypothetical protein